ncbi:WD-40 repeat-containing protein [Cyclospora cayetanensis]|uniref:WD-40 repeat-containing protein n=1 Tax=Cyclospora cayetanensis TaxID=88456 RepID=A0A1D3CZW0_9EIME|nr:WD-40 repeat-containing protein [Cyclospora cayetanensis]
MEVLKGPGGGGPQGPLGNGGSHEGLMVEGSMDEAYAAAIRCKRGGCKSSRGKKRVRLGSKAAQLPLPAVCVAWEGGAAEGDESVLLQEGPDDASGDRSAAGMDPHAAAAATAAGDCAGSSGGGGQDASEAALKEEEEAVSTETSAATAAAAASPEDEDTIFVGPPQHAIEDRVALKDWLRLVEHSDVGEAGALSEWSPADPELIVTNFAVGPPRLYRVPLSFEGHSLVAPHRELLGPPIASGAVNPGSSAHWRPDGRLLATGYESGHVSVWSQDGALLASLRASETSVICLGFSVSGTRLAAACADGQVVVWSVCPPPTRASASGSSAPIKASSAANSDVAEASLAWGDGCEGEGQHQQQKGERWTFQPCLSYTHTSGVIDLDWSGDRLLASGAIDGAVIVVDVEDGTEIRKQELAGEDVAAKESASAAAEVATLRWNAAGKLLAIVDSSSVVEVWDLSRPECQPVALRAHSEAIIKADWRNGGPHDDLELLLTVAMDRQLLLWSTRQLEAPMKRLVYDGNSFRGLAGEQHIPPECNVKCPCCLEMHVRSHPPTSLRVSRDGSRVAVGTYDSVLRVYALPSLECIASYVDLQMVIPHITWRSTHDCLAYNVFQMGKTVVLKPPTDAPEPQVQQEMQQEQQPRQLLYY